MPYFKKFYLQFWKCFYEANCSLLKYLPDLDWKSLGVINAELFKAFHAILTSDKCNVVKLVNIMTVHFVYLLTVICISHRNKLQQKNVF